MRVAFDHTIFVAQQYGGISRYFSRLADHLSLFDVQAKIIAPLHINAYLGDVTEGIVVGRKLPARVNNQRIAKIIDAAMHRPLVHANGARIVHETYFRGARLAPRNAKIVLTVYDMIHEKMPHEVGASDRSAAMKRAAIRRADAIMCISQNTRRDLIDFYPETADRAFVSLLGFDSAQTKGRADDIPTVGRPYILHVGGRQGYKNFTALLAAYVASPRLHKGFDLLCVGGAPFTPAERRLIHDAGMEGNVHQEEADDDALHRRYRDAAVFVYPSLYEGFGIPPLEAMAVACPVVTMPFSSIPEVCGDAAMYAETADAEALRVAVEAVLDSPQLADRLRLLGKARLASFSWKKCADETARVYHALG